MQSLCTLRNHCRQWSRNTRYQADATPYLGRTCTGWIAPACGWRTHSITSSAAARRLGGTVKPSGRPWLFARQKEPIVSLPARRAIDLLRTIIARGEKSWIFRLDDAHIIVVCRARREYGRIALRASASKPNVAVAIHYPFHGHDDRASDVRESGRQ